MHDTENELYTRAEPRYIAAGNNSPRLHPTNITPLNININETSLCLHQNAPLTNWY